MLMVEYRGYGGNPGQLRARTGSTPMRRAALDFLGREAIPPNRLVLYGESLGSGVAVALAAQRDVAALILEAPFTSVAEVAQCHFPSCRRPGLVHRPLRLAVEASARSRRRSWSCMASGTGSSRCASAAPCSMRRREPKEGWFVPEAGHEDLARYGALDAAVAFIERRLGG